VLARHRLLCLSAGLDGCMRLTAVRLRAQQGQGTAECALILTECCRGVTTLWECLCGCARGLMWAAWCGLCCCSRRLCRYCLLSRSSLRVSESQLTTASPEAYATMTDDLIMVHAAVELGRKVSRYCAPSLSKRRPGHAFPTSLQDLTVAWRATQAQGAWQLLATTATLSCTART
jgi:hypothetical protein